MRSLSPYVASDSLVCLHNSNSPLNCFVFNTHIMMFCQVFLPRLGNGEERTRSSPLPWPFCGTVYWRGRNRRRRRRLLSHLHRTIAMRCFSKVRPLICTLTQWFYRTVGNQTLCKALLLVLGRRGTHYIVVLHRSTWVDVVVVVPDLRSIEQPGSLQLMQLANHLFNTLLNKLRHVFAANGLYVKYFFKNHSASMFTTNSKE